MIRVIEDKNEKENISRAILTQLPEWFGLPDSMNEYISCSKEMPFWVYFDAEKPIGFIALKETGEFTAEIYVMGVLKGYHRKGIGNQLWKVFLQYAQKIGYEYVQVKTVKKGHYKEYDITNAFYEKLGFRELECFPTLWDEWNPCQVYVRCIKTEVAKDDSTNISV